MDNVKAKLAIRTPEFRKWMVDEIKVTEEQLKKLSECSVCWSNFGWRERTIKKIEEKLETIKIENQAPEWKMTNKLFYKEKKEELIEFINSSDADAFQIITRKR